MTTRSAETPERLLAAARRLFLEHNYADVSVGSIARATDVTKGGLYHHFASKEELYRAMLLACFDRLHALFLEASAPEGTCREKLARLTRAFLTLPPEERRVVRLVRRDINAFTDPARKELIESYQRALPELIEAILREGIERGEVIPVDPRLLSWNYVAQVEIVLTPYADTLFEDVDSKLEFVLDRFFRGAVPLAQESGT